MDMIGHHHPGVQRVALRVEMLERIGHQACNVWMAEVAIARATVKEGFDLPVLFVAKCGETFAGL